MAITFDHTIIEACDNEATARWLTELLGLLAHEVMGYFAVVRIGGTSLDFISTADEIVPRHFAFLVSETEFDAIFGRLKASGQGWWANPFHKQPGEINRWDDGRGVYFDDPNGHSLEILTRPYGSGGLEAKHPNPLLRQAGPGS